jgi:FkbM family methyltransferase
MEDRILPTEFVDKRRKYILFRNDCGVSDIARWGGIYEKYLFDYIRGNIDVKGKNIVDIGANFGFHSLEFAEMVGSSGKVYSFEPQRLVYYQLCGNVIVNGLGNVICHNVGLGSKEEVSELENQDYYSGKTINIGDTHTSRFTGNGKELVQIRTLDSYELENVSVIKIDVQGYEPFVLDGGRETILRNKPYIFIEIEPPQLEIYDFSPSDVFRRLEELGYTVQKILDAPHLFDYVAIPNKL